MRRPHCAACGIAFPPTHTESRPHWLRRKTCSKRCAGVLQSRRHAAARAARSRKPCARCGTDMVWNGTEDFRVFDARMFCGKSCRLADQSERTTALARRRSRVARCAELDCLHPLSDPASIYCTDQDNPCCVRRRQRRAA